MKITTFEKTIVGAILAFFILMSASTYYLVDIISEHGLKNVIEAVWEGPEK